MARFLVAILLISAVGGSAQEQTPKVLLHVAQCLGEKAFFARSKATVLSFGYVLDEKSYPGEKVVYVVRYIDRDHGEAFAVFLSEHQGQQVFNIQNNATFARTKAGVQFSGEPLGGVWTQQHLVSAIRRIERQPRFAISVSDLSPSPRVRCEAYTDNER